MKKKKIIYGFVTLVCLVLVLIASYSAWNYSHPDYTCAQCHEIRTACRQWEQSFHAGIACTDCHGTALESWKSATEKLRMVKNHYTKEQTSEDIHLSETQALAVANRCAVCHQAEQAAWQAGAHSADYEDIFLDRAHNHLERPYWDCFRCHGMFYDGDIDDLMDLQSDKPDEWYLKDRQAAQRPTITCLACHQSHHEQTPYADYSQMEESVRESLAEVKRTPPTALYMRADHRHLPAVDLQPIAMYEGDSLRQVITDPNTLLCMQCHSADIFHHIGSSDDKTPIGIHEGKSCISCHDPHSNQLKTADRDVHKKVLTLP